MTIARLQYVIVVTKALFIQTFCAKNHFLMKNDNNP